MSSDLPSILYLGQVCVSIVCKLVNMSRTFETFSSEYADNVISCITADTDEDALIAVNVMMDTFLRMHVDYA